MQVHSAKKLYNARSEKVRKLLNFLYSHLGIMTFLQILALV